MLSRGQIAARLWDGFNNGGPCLSALWERAFAKERAHAARGATGALCGECQRTFTLSPKGPKHPQKFKDQVLAAYQDRLRIRGIHRTFGVCCATLMRWRGKKPSNSWPAWTRCYPAKRVTCSN